MLPLTSAPSVCCCTLGACSVGILTKVCGNGASDACDSSVSAFGLGSFAGRVLMSGMKLFGCVGLLDAMLIALNTLCQLLNTSATAAQYQRHMYKAFV